MKKTRFETILNRSNGYGEKRTTRAYVCVFYVTLGNGQRTFSYCAPKILNALTG